MPSTDLATTIAHSWCGYGGGFSCETLPLGPTRFEQLLKKKNAAFFIVLHQCTTLLQARLTIAAALSFVAARVVPMDTAPMAPLGGQQQMKGTCRYAEPPPYSSTPVIQRKLFFNHWKTLV